MHQTFGARFLSPCLERVWVCVITFSYGVTVNNLCESGCPPPDEAIIMCCDVTHLRRSFRHDISLTTET